MSELTQSLQIAVSRYPGTMAELARRTAIDRSTLYKIINGQRRKRIAQGSGRSVQEVNQLIKQWSEMNKMMGKMRTMSQSMTGKKGKKNRRAMQNMMRDMGLDKLK